MIIYRSPARVLITDITPQEAREKGENEAAFAGRIHALFTVPKPALWATAMRFDDEVAQYFYRSTYDLRTELAAW